MLPKSSTVPTWPRQDQRGRSPSPSRSPGPAITLPDFSLRAVVERRPAGPCRRRRDFCLPTHRGRRVAAALVDTLAPDADVALPCATARRLTSSCSSGSANVNSCVCISSKRAPIAVEALLLEIARGRSRPSAAGPGRDSGRPPGRWTVCSPRGMPSWSSAFAASRRELPEDLRDFLRVGLAELADEGARGLVAHAGRGVAVRAQHAGTRRNDRRPGTQQPADSALACSGPAPPKAISAKSRGS